MGEALDLTASLEHGLRDPWTSRVERATRRLPWWRHYPGSSETQKALVILYQSGEQQDLPHDQVNGTAFWELRNRLWPRAKKPHGIDCRRRSPRTTPISARTTNRRLEKEVNRMRNQTLPNDGQISAYKGETTSFDTRVQRRHLENQFSQDTVFLQLFLAVGTSEPGGWRGLPKFFAYLLLAGCEASGAFVSYGSCGNVCAAKPGSIATSIGRRLFKQFWEFRMISPALAIYALILFWWFTYLLFVL